ncbi:MAG: threonine/serine exporter family protein [Acidaminobacteraceae bacterium]
MNLFFEFLIATVCSISFAVLFNCPKGELISAGLSGGLGWVIYSLIKDLTSSVSLSVLFAAIAVGLIGEALAHKNRKPATVFIVPGIIPLVPGYGLYYTMLTVIDSGLGAASAIGIETIFAAMSIASGLIISSALGKVFRKKANRFS